MRMNAFRKKKQQTQKINIVFIHELQFQRITKKIIKCLISVPLKITFVQALVIVYGRFTQVSRSELWFVMNSNDSALQRAYRAHIGIHWIKIVWSTYVTDNGGSLRALVIFFNLTMWQCSQYPLYGWPQSYDCLFVVNRRESDLKKIQSQQIWPQCEQHSVLIYCRRKVRINTKQRERERDACHTTPERMYTAYEWRPVSWTDLWCVIMIKHGVE